MIPEWIDSVRLIALDDVYKYISQRKLCLKEIRFILDNFVKFFSLLNTSDDFYKILILILFIISFNLRGSII